MFKTKQRLQEAKWRLKEMQEAETVKGKQLQNLSKGQPIIVSGFQLDKYILALSSFLCLARSITSILQKEYANNEAFKNWYSLKQKQMRNDPLFKRMVALRNMELKEGTIAPHLTVSIDLKSQKIKAEFYFEKEEKETITPICQRYFNKLSSMVEEAEKIVSSKN